MIIDASDLYHEHLNTKTKNSFSSVSYKQSELFWFLYPTPPTLLRRVVPSVSVSVSLSVSVSVSPLISSYFTATDLLLKSSS